MKQIIKTAMTIFALTLALAACGSSSDAEDSATATETEEAVADSAEDETETTEADAEDGEPATEDADTSADAAQVEVNLVDELDGILNGYCLDIAGGNESVDPANGLQAHTCYSYDGALGTDQVFESAEFGNDTLYMPVYDVCAEVADLSAGSVIGLNTCDGSELQAIVFDADGTIRPLADTTLCFTAGAESRTGRSGDHQIRDLSLETCADDLTSLQQWSSRTGL